MMGERRVMQEALFYGFSLERHVPDNHLLRKIDRFVDLSEVRTHLEPYYSETGRPSIDPELMMRMLIVGYCFGIRSERRLCDEVHLNLAYRWFCRLGLDADLPDHSTFSKNRHGRFRESDRPRRRVLLPPHGSSAICGRAIPSRVKPIDRPAASRGGVA
jgi:transposase